jgi:hypothetical protein
MIGKMTEDHDQVVTPLFFCFVNFDCLLQHQDKISFACHYMG